MLLCFSQRMHLGV